MEQKILKMEVCLTRDDHHYTAEQIIIALPLCSTRARIELCTHSPVPLTVIGLIMMHSSTGEHVSLPCVPSSGRQVI